MKKTLGTLILLAGIALIGLALSIPIKVVLFDVSVSEGRAGAGFIVGAVGVVVILIGSAIGFGFPNTES